MKVLYYSNVFIPVDVCFQEFDEDLGFEDMCLFSGLYRYRVLDFFGWHPVQILVDGVWIDIPTGALQFIK